MSACEAPSRYVPTASTIASRRPSTAAPLAAAPAAGSGSQATPQTDAPQLQRCVVSDVCAALYAVYAPMLKGSEGGAVSRLVLTQTLRMGTAGKAGSDGAGGLVDTGKMGMRSGSEGSALRACAMAKRRHLATASAWASVGRAYAFLLADLAATLAAAFDELRPRARPWPDDAPR